MREQEGRPAKVKTSEGEDKVREGDRRGQKGTACRKRARLAPEMAHMSTPWPSRPRLVAGSLETLPFMCQPTLVLCTVLFANES